MSCVLGPGEKLELSQAILLIVCTQLSHFTRRHKKRVLLSACKQKRKFIGKDILNVACLILLD